MPDPADSQPPARSSARLGVRITWLGLVVNVLLAGLKGTVGILAGSRALVADGAHSLTDLVSDALGCAAEVHFGVVAAQKRVPHVFRGGGTNSTAWFVCRSADTAGRPPGSRAAPAI